MGISLRGREVRVQPGGQWKAVWDFQMPHGGASVTALIFKHNKVEVDQMRCIANGEVPRTRPVRGLPRSGRYTRRSTPPTEGALPEGVCRLESRATQEPWLGFILMEAKGTGGRLLRIPESLTVGILDGPVRGREELVKEKTAENHGLKRNGRKEEAYASQRG